MREGALPSPANQARVIQDVLALAAREIPAEKKFRLVGSGRTPVLALGWGSTKGAIVDALRRIDPEGSTYSFLQIRIMRPFPTEEVLPILQRAGKVVCFDGNFSEQLAQLVRSETGFQPHHRVVKYDGRPFSEDEVVTALEKAVSGGTERMVVSGGRVVEPEFAMAEFDRMVELRRKHGKMLPPMVPLPPGYNR